MTTAGRTACSARQLVASIDGSGRKEEHGVEFGGQRCGEAFGVVQRRRGVDEPGKLRDESAADRRQSRLPNPMNTG